MNEKKKNNVKTIVKDILIACVIAFVISLFIRPTLVKETSMEPTVRADDYVIEFLMYVLADPLNIDPEIFAK